MNWAWDERSRLADLLAEHAFLAFVPVLVGLLLAVPLGVLIARSAAARWPLLTLCAFVQAVPVFTLFVVLPALLNTRVSDGVNVLVALTLFVLALLTRTVADSLAAVPGHVRLAADAMGMSPLARLTRVELPVALPALISGLRTVTVACVSLVTIAALVGVEGLGTLFTEGFETRFETEILVGGALVVLLALVADVALVRAARLLAPWSRLVPVR